MEIISSIFSPLLTVYASEKADAIAVRNGFNSLAQVLEPFLNVRGKIATPTASVENFSARLASNKEGVALGINTRALQSLGGSQELGDYLQKILQVRVSSEHETLNHPLASLIIVSTADSDPMAEAFSLYNESQNRIKNLNLDYIKEDLKLYILLHDSATGVNADAIFATFKKKTNLVHLIKLNCLQDSVKDYWAGSVLNARIRANLSSLDVSPPSVPVKSQKTLELTSSPLSNIPILSDKSELDDYDPTLYGKFLSRDDIENIRVCMKDFVAYQVITYMGEKMIEWDRDVIAVSKI